jgi:maltooligosyltrehalose trehalohydrolase
VEVETGGECRAMQPEPEGWWRLDVPSAGKGSDYAFRLDGGDPVPDPRSAWQPHGPMRFSRLVDHGEFAWTDGPWQSRPLSAAVIYELHTGTFTPEGTFDGVVTKLDHLCDLGVTHIELLPVSEFAGSRGWGYDGVDLYAPYHRYGGPDGLKRLVDACHARGIGVIQDVVYNHFGPAGCFLARFGPYFTNRHKTPWGEAVNYDGRESDEVRRFVLDNAAGWFRDYHMDGLRLDGVHAILDTSAVHILEELGQVTRELSTQLGRHLFLIAESDLNDPRIVRPTAVGGYGMGAQWSDDFHHALHVTLTGEQSGYYGDFDGLNDLARVLRQGFVYDGRYSRCRERRHGRPATGLPGCRFLGYLQNHDQVGNRARGERIGHLVSPERARIGAAIVMTAPFVPMIFQGEEWSAGSPFQYFSSFEDPDLGRAVSEGRREEFVSFGWDPAEVPDPQAASTFERSKLNWAEPAREPHAGMLAWYRDLIRARRRIGDLADDCLERVRVACDPKAGRLVVQRGHSGVFCNLSGRSQPADIPPGVCREVALVSRPRARLEGGQIHLPPDSVAILAPPA